MRRRGALRIAAAAGLAAATAVLYRVSLGKWSDALIDSGREWIVPDALSRGELLYRDVVYWFGPFTPYFQSAFVSAAGSGFPALVLSGAVAASGVLAAFYLATRLAAGARAARRWTALAVPVLVFMPNAGGALLGMGYRIWQAAGFALAATVLASGSRRWPRALRLLGAGACAGLSGLCRTEWGLAAVAAAMLAAFVRPRRRSSAWREAVLAGVGFAVVFGAGLGLFLWKAGTGPVIAEGHVLLTGIPAETRHFLVAFSGLPDWRSGIPELLYSTAMWAALFWLAAWFSWPAERTRPRFLGVGLIALVGVLAGAALLGGAGGAVLFSAAPLVCALGLVAGLRRRGGSAAASLAASGLLGALLSYRRLFHIGDSAYVAPPLLFAFVCAAGLLRLAAASRRRADERDALQAGFSRLVAVLIVAAFAGRAWQYASWEASVVAGTGGMLSASPDVAREIEELGRAVRGRTREGDGLVVFPEGELLNYLSGRPNPVRHKLYLPGYLTAENEAAVLRELEAARPAAVVLWRRPVSEYDRSLFGEDYGRSICDWIERHYRLESFRAAGAPARANPRFVLGIAR